jgi:hypothetical protein
MPAVVRPFEPGRPVSAVGSLPGSVCINWYTPSEARLVELYGMQVLVRFIGHKGRRGRIAITAPAGAVFRAVERRADDVT